MYIVLRSISSPCCFFAGVASMVGSHHRSFIVSLSFMRGAPITPPSTWSQGELDIIIAGGEITRPLILLSNQTWF
jgi:hypothetical protein